MYKVLITYFGRNMRHLQTSPLYTPSEFLWLQNHLIRTFLYRVTAFINLLDLSHLRCPVCKVSPIPLSASVLTLKFCQPENLLRAAGVLPALFYSVTSSKIVTCIW